VVKYAIVVIMSDWTIVNDGQLCDLSYDNGEDDRQFCGEIAKEQVDRYRVCRQCADFLRSMKGIAS
jgi:rubredoxin